jgi:hypothetical protein
MIKGLLLIFDTARTWQMIASVPRRWGTVFLTHVLPLLVLTSFAEGYSLVHWGRVQDISLRVKKFGIPEATAYEVTQFLLTLVVIFFCAKLIKSMGETFHGRHTFGQAFIVLAYGLSPLFLFRFLDMIPGLTPWVGWGAGVLLSIGIIYYGLPCIMQPDPPHAFGLYLTSSILIIMTSGLVRFVTAWYLLGKFEKLNHLFPQF